MNKGFLTFSKENDLIEKGDHVLVGVSGGVDSVVLLDVLNNFKRELGIKIAVAHVNYGLRYEADRDQEFVRDLTEKYGLPFFTKKVRLTGSNIEEKARDIRYDFLKETLQSEKMNKVAVAHHKNDLAETFFLNLSRGSGLTGLISMKPKGGDLIRPLLFATRKDIEKYAKENKLKYVEDVTNKDLSFKRNLIRHKVIPELEKNNPNFVETLSDEIDRLRETDNFLRIITDKHYKKIATEEKSSVSMSAKELAELHPYLQAEILRKSLLHIKGDLRDISRKNIEDVLKLTNVPHGTKKVVLTQGLLVKRVYDKLEITKEAKSPMLEPKIIRLEMEKEAVFGNWRLFLGKTEGKNTKEGKNLVFLDIQKDLKLLVRYRKSGDRVAVGKGKTKSLQDIFVDAKIPREERDSYPVIVNERDKVVWVPALRLSESHRATSKEIISIKATPLT